MSATTDNCPTAQPNRKRPLPKDADETLLLELIEDEVLLTKKPLMITLLIGQCEVKRLSVDNRCLRNILFTSTLARMQQGWDKVEGPIELTSLPDGTTHQVVGKVILAVKPAKWTRVTPRRMLFSVVEADSIYNEILGMSLQGYLGLFLTQGGTDLSRAVLPSISSVQHEADQENPLKEEPDRARSQEESLIDLLDTREDLHVQRVSPVEEVEKIPLERSSEKYLQTGSCLKEPLKARLVDFLRSNLDVFAWTPSDMPGINPEVIAHELNIQPQ